MEDLAFWASYLTNGRHLNWYISFQYTVYAALLGGTFALLFGLGGAALRNSPNGLLRLIGAAYTNMVRGVPDVLFFLFFPLAFEQLVELFLAQGAVAVSPGNEKLLAGLVACAVAWRFRLTFATIAAGLVALHFFAWLF